MYNVQPGESLTDAVIRVYLFRHEFLKKYDYGIAVEIEEGDWGIHVAVWKNESYHLPLAHQLTREIWFSDRLHLGDAGPTLQRPEGARWDANEEQWFESSHSIFKKEISLYGGPEVSQRNRRHAVGLPVEPLQPKVHPQPQPPDSP